MGEQKLALPLRSLRRARGPRLGLGDAAMSLGLLCVVDNSISNIASHLATGVTFRPGLRWALLGHGAAGTSAAQLSAAVLRRSVSFGRVSFAAAVHRLYAG